MAHALTSDSEGLHADYIRDGFVVVPAVLPPLLIEEIRREIVQIFCLADRRGDAQQHADIESETFHNLLRRMFEEDFEAYHGAAKLCNHALSLHRLGTEPGLVSTLRSLGVQHPIICARPIVWFHAPHLATGSRYHQLPAHQEWSNMQGSIDGAVMWTPLMPISREMGRLQVVPGSHVDGLRALASEPGSDYPLSMAPETVNDADFVEVDVPPGSALIFSPFLVHRSGKNETGKARITTNFRFNNAADPTFADRHFLNPFHYEAPTDLKTPGFPSSDLIRRYFQAKRP